MNMVGVGVHMTTPNVPDAVTAMRSYQYVVNASPNSSSLLSSWIQRHTDESLAADFDYKAAIAVLAYFNHPLYTTTTNQPTGTAAWVSLMNGAESILQAEASWIDDQLLIANITRPQRLFDSDITWLSQWAAANNVSANTETAYLLNSLILQLQICEGTNGATNASSVSHTVHTSPTVP